jgi:iron(III) transport system permease protein
MAEGRSVELGRAVLLRRSPLAGQGLGRRLADAAVPAAIGMAVGLPIVWLLISSFNTSRPARPAEYGLDNWARAFADPDTVRSLWNSLAIGGAYTLISMPMAIGVAWLITRTDLPGRRWIEALSWLGVFVPHLPLVFGWILLLDPRFGLVNDVLHAIPFLQDAAFDVYGYGGIVWVHLASGAIYYKVVLLAPAFRRLGSTLEEAARVSGASQLTTFSRITVPVLLPAMLAVLILSFVRSLESFETELLLGRPVGIFVYSTSIFTYLKEDPPRFGEATALGSLFLVLLIGLAVMYRRALAGREFATITGRADASRPFMLGQLRWPLAALCFGFLGFALVAPTVLLVAGSFMRRFGFFHLRDAFTVAHWRDLVTDPIFGSSVWNSLLIATGTAFAVVLVYSLIAYFVARRRGRSAAVSDLLAWLPWALPGILLGLGLLWLFLATPLRTALYGTIFGIVIALAIKDSPLSTQLFKAAYLQIGADLEDSARVHGASWLRTYRRVYLPLIAPAALTVWLLSFVSATRDIAVPALLYSPSSRPLSILMLEYSFTGERERGAAIGVLITAFVMALMVGLRVFSRRLLRDRL